MGIALLALEIMRANVTRYCTETG